MSILTQDQLAVLALVGSDASYTVPNIPFPFPPAPNASGPDLQSYPDSVKKEDEYGFANSLAGTLSKNTSATNFNISNVPSPSTKNVDAIDFPSWERIKEINPGDEYKSGFDASIFRLRGTNEYVVALRGTDGNNLKDWRNNLGFAVKVWNDEKSKLFQALFSPAAPDGAIPAKGTIHFVGQSLGGGLAQYAAYEFVNRLKSPDPALNAGIQYDKNKVTLTTFNSFGGAQGLQEIFKDSGGFDPNLLAGVQTAHYATENDIVHLLGATTINGRTIGHLNGKTFLIDFRRPDSGGAPLADSDPQSFPNLVDAHRIETGFYRGFDIYSTDFDNTVRIRPTTYDYLDVSGIQPIASFFSRLFEGKDSTTSEFSAGTGVALGIAGGLALGSPVQVKKLADTFIDSGYRSGAYGLLTKFGLEVLNFGTFLANVAATFASPLVLLGRVWSSFAGAFSLSDADKLQTQTGMSTLFAPRDSSVPVVTDAPSDESEANKVARLNQSVAVATAKVRPDQISQIFTDSKMRLAVQEMSSVESQANFNADELAARLGAGGDWQRAELDYFNETEVASGASAAADVELVASLLAGFREEGKTLGEFDPEFKAQTEASLRAFIENDVAKAIANLYDKFTTKYSDADPNVFNGAREGFATIAKYKDALEQTARDPRFLSVRDLLEDGVQIVAQAGEKLHFALQAGPQQLSAFESDTPLNAGTIREGGGETFVASLPFAAGEGGQRFRVKIDGDSANIVRIETGDTLITPQNGEFELTIDKGGHHEGVLADYAG